MTLDDTVVYLRSIREDYASRLHVGTLPKKQGDWIPPGKRDYYHLRIRALDNALVAILTLTKS